MATDIKCAHLVGSGILENVASSVTVGETRIRSIHATGSGTFTVESTNALGHTDKLRFECTIDADLDFTSTGIRMSGTVVSVSAPTSASTITIFYG